MRFLQISTRCLLMSFMVAVLLLMADVGDASNCGGTSTGKLPLTDLGTGIYKNFQGGLYPGGSNSRPEGHEQAGQALAESIRPLNPAGSPDSANGRIVLLSIGLSNTTQEWRVFMNLASNERNLNPKLAIVDGAQGGQAAEDVVDPNAPYWNTVAGRLREASVTAAQVQAIWLKSANRNPSLPFPGQAQTLQAQITQILHNLNEKFPNLKLVYLSSRIYAGYASTQLNPEPYAYEYGFSIKWLIESQINGSPELNYDANKGAVRAPWLSWGPYLWADGLNPRSDGLIWQCRDFNDDGTHPSQSGREKVAQMLLTFFKTDATTKMWFGNF